MTGRHWQRVGTLVGVTATAVALAVPARAVPQTDAPAGRHGQDLVPRVVPDLPHGLDAGLWEATGHTRFRGAAAPRDAAGRVVVYVDGQDQSAVRAAVAEAGGVVSGTLPGIVRAAVPDAGLATLAAQPGVADVRPPERAIPMSVTSEGVAASNANNWIQDGRKGAGAKVGILDVGFDGLADAQAAGELPGSLPENTSNCAAPDGDAHGTATAEVVADMAPQAQLYLACADDSVGFAAAADWLTSQGAQVIVSALGFATTGRGDGTGEAGGPADVVRQARQHGILWIAAAGNEAQLHLSGTAVDATNDGYVELSGGAENNGFSVPAGGGFTVALRWDAWPTTSQDLDLVVMKTADFPKGPTDPNVAVLSTRQQSTTTGGLSPTEQTLKYTNDTGTTQTYWIFVPTKASYPGTRFDLTVFGDALSLQFSSPGGSIVEPASSPYAMAVGASRPTSNVAEAYSGRGPTVDGRVKPDLTGYDAVSTATFGPNGFTGTSAAAAHVAGAAALLKGANPGLDASQIEAMLERRGGHDPQDNALGHGLLSLGPPEAADAVTAPTGDPYTALANPTRILDTRTTIGGHNKRLSGGETLAVLPPGVPGDASAVVVNLTGVSPTAGTYLALTGTAFNGTTSTLNLPANKLAASVTAVVPLSPVDGAFRVYNNSGTVDVIVDLIGYFNKAGGATYFAEPVPQRVVDTRTSLGGHPAKLAAGEVLTLPVRGTVGIPSTATSVLVNITVTQGTATTYVTAYGQNLPSGISTVNFDAGETRANLDIVGIGSDGAIRIRNASGQTHVIVDVVGWFASGTGARYVALPQPVRVLETRTGTGFRHSPLGPGEQFTLPVAGLDGVPYAAAGVLLDVVGIQPTANQFLTVWSADQPYPSLSSLNVNAGAVTGNAVTVPLGTSGQVAIRNSAGTVNVLADLQGYFTS